MKSSQLPPRPPRSVFITPLAVTRRAAGASPAAAPLMAKVLNLRGRRGILPEGAVYIGDRVYRGSWRLPASKWANPFKIDRPDKKRDGTRDEVIAKYRAWIVRQPELMAALPELRVKDLACWCAPKRCHGDVLLELAKA